MSADEVVVTPGGKPIIYYTLHALVNPGDEVLYPNPGFPIYESVTRFIGGVPVPVPLLEEKDFSLDTDHLKELVTPKTKVIILCSPQNPNRRGSVRRGSGGDRQDRGRKRFMGFVG